MSVLTICLISTDQVAFGNFHKCHYPLNIFIAHPISGLQIQISLCLRDFHRTSTFRSVQDWTQNMKQASSERPTKSQNLFCILICLTCKSLIVPITSPCLRCLTHLTFHRQSLFLFSFLFGGTYLLMLSQTLGISKPGWGWGGGYFVILLFSLFPTL